MIEALRHPTVQKFIHDHENEDEKTLLLKHKEIHGVPAARIAEQITGRRKAKTKLPLYYNTPGILYPAGLGMEQCSSEKTADFKAALLKDQISNKTCCADLTGGFGIDALFISRIVDMVHFVEPNEALLQLARHNHQLLKAENIVYHNTTAEAFLKDSPDRFDAVFIDPDRRDKHSKKMFRLNECEPDITTLAGLVFEKSDILLLKASPWLDIQQGVHDLPFVKKVVILALDNECKESLYLCVKNYHEEATIETVNLTSNSDQRFLFLLSAEKESVVQYSEPLRYLYDPNAAIRKAGGFKTLAAEYNLLKIHPNTHLYTSDTLIQPFPGRVFSIEAFVKPRHSALKEFLPDLKANVITRNYPLQPDELKKKLSLKDGGDKFLIAFTGEKNRKHLAFATAVQPNFT